MSSSFVKADLSKLNRLIQELEKNSYVDIGIIETSMYPDSGKSVAEVGATHEFGTDKAGRGKNTKLAERSFIRMPLEEKGKEIQKDAEYNLEENLAEGKIDKVLSIIGESGVAQIQKAFETGGFGKWQPLAQNTINAKGSSSILIDQAILRKSMNYSVTRGK